MNRGGQALLELGDLGALRGADWLGFWSLEDQVLARKALEAAGAGGRGHFQGERADHPGQRKFWDLAVMPVRDASGQPIQLMVSSRDLTALRAAQQQASEMNAQVVRVLSSIQEAFISLDSEWRFIYLNRQAERMLGRRASELLNQSIWDLFPETPDNRAAAEMRRAVREQSSSKLEYFSPLLQRWLELRLFPYAGGLAMYFQDIAHKKREEQAQHDRNTVLEMTVQGRALPEVLHQVAVMTERQWPNYVCTILLNEGGRLYTRAAHPACRPRFSSGVDGLEVREGAGMCGTAASRQEMVVVEDVTKDPYLPGLSSICCWPTSCGPAPRTRSSTARGKVLGTLAIYARQPGPFPDELLSRSEKGRSSGRRRHRAPPVDPAPGHSGDPRFAHGPGQPGRCLSSSCKRRSTLRELTSCRWRCCLSISTISRASTTRWGTRWATRCCASSPPGCKVACARAICSRASAATSSR